jgi:hypothetical protein
MTANTFLGKADIKAKQIYPLFNGAQIQYLRLLGHVSPLNGDCCQPEDIGTFQGLVAEPPPGREYGCKQQKEGTGSGEFPELVFLLAADNRCLLRSTPAPTRPLPNTGNSQPEATEQTRAFCSRLPIFWFVSSQLLNLEQNHQIK